MANKSVMDKMRSRKFIKYVSLVIAIAFVLTIFISWGARGAIPFLARARYDMEVFGRPYVLKDSFKTKYDLYRVIYNDIITYKIYQNDFYSPSIDIKYDIVNNMYPSLEDEENKYAYRVLFSLINVVWPNLLFFHENFAIVPSYELWQDVLFRIRGGLAPRMVPQALREKMFNMYGALPEFMPVYGISTEWQKQLEYVYFDFVREVSAASVPMDRLKDYWNNNIEDLALIKVKAIYSRSEQTNDIMDIYNSPNNVRKFDRIFKKLEKITNYTTNDLLISRNIGWQVKSHFIQANVYNLSNYVRLTNLNESTFKKSFVFCERGKLFKVEGVITKFEKLNKDQLKALALVYKLNNYDKVYTEITNKGIAIFSEMIKDVKKGKSLDYLSNKYKIKVYKRPLLLVSEFTRGFDVNYLAGEIDLASAYSIYKDDRFKGVDKIDLNGQINILAFVSRFAFYKGVESAQRLFKERRFTPDMFNAKAAEEREKVMERIFPQNESEKNKFFVKLSDYRLYKIIPNYFTFENGVLICRKRWDENSYPDRGAIRSMLKYYYDELYTYFLETSRYNAIKDDDIVITVDIDKYFSRISKGKVKGNGQAN